MRIIWATRGHSWGFRFLRDGGFEDPLPPYSEAFSGIETEPEVLRRGGGVVAFRFLDPYDRHDRAGRPIAHDVVAFDGLEGFESPEAGHKTVWPELQSQYAQLWDGPQAFQD